MNTPKVVLYGISSIDGRVTLAPGVLLMFGDKRWEEIAGSDTQTADWLRNTHKPTAYLEGSGSLVTEGTKPEPLPDFKGNPRRLYSDFLPASVVRRPEHQGWFTVVDTRGLIRWAYKEWPSQEWKGWHLMVIVANKTPPAYLAYLQREHIPYLVAGNERADLGEALKKMGDKLEVTSVVSTSPGKLGGALLRAGLVKEINIVFVPAIIGGFKTPSLFASPELKPHEWPTRLKLISAKRLSRGRFWLRYAVLPEGKRKRKTKRKSN